MMGQVFPSDRNGFHPVPAQNTAMEDAQARLIDAATALLAGAAMFILIMTLTPFQGGAFVEPASNDGNIINQVGYLSLGALYLFCLFAFVDRRVLVTLLSPAWIIVFMVAFWSSRHAFDPAAATRGVMLTALSMTLVAAVILLPRSERSFVNACSTAVLLLIVIDYAAVFLIPGAATHTAAGGEPWHAGSWRGHLIHKNFAAPVFSVLAMFGIYCWRSGVVIRGSAIFLLAAFFVLKTQSKTTTGFLPLAVMLVLMARIFGKPALVIFLHLILTAVIACLTIGTVMSPQLLALTTSLIEDPTFTGRDEIWRFGIASLPHKLWEGYGYFSFWLSPTVVDQEANFEAAWDVRGIVSGHNTYLDALLTFGVPAGSTVILILMGKPLFDYLSAYRRPENRALADFMLMIVVFMTYNGMLESYFLNRADPMWLLFALGSFGMTIVSRFSIRREEFTEA
jgi:O-antigen ligase